MPEEKAMIPFIVFESAEARAERHTRRLVFALILSIILTFATNLAWLYVWLQYDTISYEQDGEGINNVNLGLMRDLNNGAEGESQEAEER